MPGSGPSEFWLKGTMKDVILSEFWNKNMFFFLLDFDGNLAIQALSLNKLLKSELSIVPQLTQHQIPTSTACYFREVAFFKRVSSRYVSYL